MVSPKKNIRAVSGRLATKLSVQKLCSLSGRFLFAPFYHLVTDEPCPHIDPIYRPRRTANFEDDLDYMLRFFKPIGLEELNVALSQSESGKPMLDQPRMFLSFDDGLRQIDDIVPLLERKGIPATFFLNPSFIDNEGLMFRYKAALLMTKMHRNPPGPGVLKEVSRLLNSTVSDKGTARTRIPRIQNRSRSIVGSKARFGKVSNKSIPPLLQLGYGQDELLHQIAVLVEVDFEHFLRTYKPYMTTGQIQKLITKGFTVGGHSLDHPLYAGLDLNTQLQQTAQCMQKLEDKFIMPVRSFAFPFSDIGVRTSFFNTVFGGSPPVLDLSFGGSGLKRDIYRNLQRVPMEGSSRKAADLITEEYSWYILKHLLGRSKMRRN